MRDAILDGELIRSEGLLVGIGIGYDFCSEHEQGISKILDSFGCPYKKSYGIAKYKITKNNAISGQIDKDDKTLHFIYSPSSYMREKLDKEGTSYIVSYLNNSINHRFEDGFYAAWSEDEFVIFFEDVFIRDHFYTEFCKLNIAFTKSTSFLGRGGINIIFYDAIPSQEVKISAKKDIKLQKDIEKHDSNPVFKKIENKRKEWQKKYNTWNTPWDSIALSHHMGGTWLNPRHQSFLYWGPVTFKEIDDWAEGKVGKIIPSQERWDALLWLCKGDNRTAAQWKSKHFNHFPAELLHPNNMFGPKAMLLPKIVYKQTKEKYDKKEFTPEFIKAIEGHIKWLIEHDFKNQIERYDNYDKKITYENVHISQELSERLYGFFEALSLMGIGGWGASNTPKVRENFSWWKDMLEDEVQFEKISEYDPPPEKLDFEHPSN